MMTDTPAIMRLDWPVKPSLLLTGLDYYTSTSSIIETKITVAVLNCWRRLTELEQETRTIEMTVH